MFAGGEEKVCDVLKGQIRIHRLEISSIRYETYTS